MWLCRTVLAVTGAPDPVAAHMAQSISRNDPLALPVEAPHSSIGKAMLRLQNEAPSVVKAETLRGAAAHLGDPDDAEIRRRASPRPARAMPRRHTGPPLPAAVLAVLVRMGAVPASADIGAMAARRRHADPVAAATASFAHVEIVNALERAAARADADNVKDDTAGGTDPSDPGPVPAPFTAGEGIAGGAALRHAAGGVGGGGGGTSSSSGGGGGGGSSAAAAKTAATSDSAAAAATSGSPRDNDADADAAPGSALEAAAAAVLARGPRDPLAAMRDDVDTIAVAIDAAETRDVDDAVSYLGSGIFEVHIADVDAWIAAGSLLDTIARLVRAVFCGGSFF
jgi:hypothetical protein